MTTCVKSMRSFQEGQVSSFVQVPTTLLRSGIPSDELHVYLILCDFAGKSCVCYPSDRTIGGLIGKSQDTASRILGRLEARRLISRQAVPKSDENPTGRVICTLVRVTQAATSLRQPPPAPCGSAPANGNGAVAAPLRQDLDSKEKKQYPAGGGVARAAAPPPAEHQDPEPPAATREEWDALNEATRAETLAAVKAANPGLAQFPKLLLPLCLVELAARPPAPPIPAPAGPAAECPKGPGYPAEHTEVTEGIAPTRLDPVRPAVASQPRGATGDVIPYAVVPGASRLRRKEGGRADILRSTRSG
jgi:hypothetical protein